MNFEKNQPKLSWMLNIEFLNKYLAYNCLLHKSKDELQEVPCNSVFFDYDGRMILFTTEE
jgi:hypothetical protein